MKTYTNLINLYGRYTRDVSAANLTMGGELLNDGYRKVLGYMEWPFLQANFNLLTVSQQQFYSAPSYLSKPASVTVSITNQRYTPQEAPSRQFWDRLNIVSNITSDYPEFWYFYDGQIGLYPTPATSGNTISVVTKYDVRDLRFADYTTGTVTSVTNAQKLVTGTATAWTAAMAGRMIKIAASNAANNGDDAWYRIASVPSPTTLNLVRAYGGTSIAAGTAAYVIGQVPLIPENYQMLPVYYATAEYWSTQEEGAGRAADYTNKYTALLEQMEKEFSSPTSGVVLDYGRRHRIDNPNLFVTIP